MKTLRSDIQSKSIFRIFTITVMILAFTSCAIKSSFLNSSVVPGAEGYVKMKIDKNKNYRIKIEISNLASPDRLDPPKSNYIVWMDDGNNNIKNMGQIKTSSSFMSKALKASFENISSFRPVKIFITSEYESNVQIPSTGLILTTNNF